jgi:hypothetical protein
LTAIGVWQSVNIAISKVALHRAANGIPLMAMAALCGAFALIAAIVFGTLSVHPF